MTDLSEFLRARLDEDEQAANKYEGEPWEHPGGPSEIVATTESDYPCLRIDKPRVLAEVDAKRRIIDDRDQIEQRYQKSLANYDEDSGLVIALGAKAKVFDDVLRLLVLPYASHPDYRQEWKP